MKRYFYFLTITVLLTACGKECSHDVHPVLPNGYFKLDRIEMPSRTVKMEELGREEIIRFDAQGSTRFMYTFIDGKQTDRFLLAKWATAAEEKDGETFLEAVVGAQFIKLKQSGSRLITSGLLYKESSDTVRYYYYQVEHVNL